VWKKLDLLGDVGEMFQACEEQKQVNLVESAEN